MKTYVRLWQYLAEFFLDKSFRENPNNNFVFNKFFMKIVPFVMKCVKTW
jgi:hypothetical protein